MHLQRQFKALKSFGIINRNNSNWAQNLMNYFHRGGQKKIRQVGDPILRARAKPVELAYLIAPEFKEMVDELVSTLRKKNAAGIAAPQIGVSLQVIAAEVTGHDLKIAIQKYGSKGVTKMQMTLFPLTVMINPKIRVIDPTTVAFKEGCLSVQNFTAVVPRSQEIAVEALNLEGETINFTAVGWTARIIQHEVDHLNGNLFVDCMSYKTLTNEKWRSYKS